MSRRVSAPELGKNIAQLAGFLREQRQLLQDDAWKGMIAKHLAHLVNQIQGLQSLTPGDATELTTQINALPMTDEFKQSLSQEISAALLKPPKRNAQKDLQDCPTFGAYLSEADLARLRDPTLHVNEKLDTLAVRCLKINLIYPNEQTTGRILTAGVAAGIPAEDHAEFYQRVRTFKAKLKTKRQSVDDKSRYPLLLPMTPNLLPAEVFESAYGADPVGQAIPAADLERVQQFTSLRKSKKAVQSNPLQLALCGTGSGSASSGSAGAAGFANMPNMNPWQMFGMFMNMCQQQQQNQDAQQEQDARSLRLQFSMPGSTSSKRPKAIMDADRPSKVPKRDSQQTEGDDTQSPAPALSSPAKAPTTSPPALPNALLMIPDIAAEEQAQWLGVKGETNKPKAAPSKAAMKASPKANQAKAKGAPAKAKGIPKAPAKATAARPQPPPRPKPPQHPQPLPRPQRPPKAKPPPSLQPSLQPRVQPRVQPRFQPRFQPKPLLRAKL